MNRRGFLKTLVALPLVAFVLDRIAPASNEYDWLAGMAHFLTTEEQRCLVYADAVLHDGSAGATFAWDRVPGHHGYEHWVMKEGLRARRLLRWTAQDPELMGYPENIDGWYTITERGRAVARKLDQAAVIRAHEEEIAEFERDLMVRGVMLPRTRADEEYIAAHRIFAST